MARLRVFLFLILLSLPFAARGQSVQKNALELKPFVVTGTRPSAADSATPEVSRTYGSSEIEDSGSFSIEEFIGNLPPDSSGGQQLVLIDGVPAYLDLSALTPAMIAGIDVSNSGAMPSLGAYATGRILNIRLKQDYGGRTLSLRSGASLHADAWHRYAAVSGGVSKGPWKAFYSVNYYQNEAVTADARNFSRGQDNRARGGRDFRLPWGDPPVVQAVTGNLTGVLDASGQPVATALVPAGSVATPAPGGFLPGTMPTASGQRFFNTSPYLYLSTPSEIISANLQLTYTTMHKVNFNFSASFRRSQGSRNGPPPVTPVSAATLVPAALNPFGQDVEVGLVHPGFGPVVQWSDDHNARFTLGASGLLPHDWKWFSQLSQGRNETGRDTRDLDPARFTAALAAADPALRFNPFAAADPHNAILYPSLAVHRTQDTRTDSTRFSGRSTGPWGQGWGAGPVQLSFNGSASARAEQRTSRNLRGVADADTLDHDSSWSASGTADIPLVGKKPGLYRLSGLLAANYSATSAGSATRSGDAGLTWSPVKAWLFRASFNDSRSTPGQLGDNTPETNVVSLVDPRRVPAIAENVQVTVRRAIIAETQRRHRLYLSVTHEPAFLPGLSATVSYRADWQDHANDSPFDPQDVIDNESLLAGRVVRADPTVLDLALGQPGAILVVDATSAAVARQMRRGLDLDVEYRTPEHPWGRITLNVNASWVLANRYELANGQPFLSNESDSANPPAWNGRMGTQWQRKSWSVYVRMRYTAATDRSTTPARTDLGVDVGYRFLKPVWRNYGKDLQLRFSGQNLGADRPPYADTILGYRGGSAVGTMVFFSAQIPL